MISRLTAHSIANLVTVTFQRYKSTQWGGQEYSDEQALYDFLCNNDFPAWFCNLARQACSSSSTRPLKEFLMKIHTGESQFSATADWTWPQRERLGQQLLRQIAEATINRYDGQ